MFSRSPRVHAACLALALLLLASPPAWADPPAWPPPDPEPFRDLVEAGRVYFDLEEELWDGRKRLIEALTAHARAGTFHLEDMDALRWFVHQARSFSPDLRQRRWQRAHGVTAFERIGPTLYGLESEALRIAFSVPRQARSPQRLKRDYPRPAPYPLLLALHEERDFTGQRYPGKVLLERRFPRPAWDALYEEWLALVPIAAAGNYVTPDGLVRAEVLKQPWAEFWKHYPVDFERGVLDGADQALTVAAAMPMFFAGIVFRGDWTLESDAQRDVVRNFAPVPVYVVDNPSLAAELRKAGHPDVIAGDGGAALFAWMGERRRREPRAFTWSARTWDQVLAWWINLDAPDWEAPARRLRVEVVDTEAHPNTVCIEATGLDRLSLFLNDETVDLDRPVRVVVNGHLEHDALLAPEREAMRAIGRDLDALFNREPLVIRTSMYFGWLKTARIAQLGVRPRVDAATCFTAPAQDPPPAEPAPREAPAPPAPGRPRPAPEEPGLGPGLIVALAFGALLLLLAILLVADRRRRRKRRA